MPSERPQDVKTCVQSFLQVQDALKWQTKLKEEIHEKFYQSYGKKQLPGAVARPNCKSAAAGFPSCSELRDLI